VQSLGLLGNVHGAGFLGEKEKTSNFFYFVKKNIRQVPAC